MEIRPLNQEGQSALSEGLDLASRYLEQERPLTIEHVQVLYDVICEDFADNIEKPKSLWD